MKIKTIRILLVEDNENHLALIRKAFNSYRGKYKLASARNLREARKLIRESGFDLIISEIKLPDGEGTELLAPGKGMITYPVMIMTGFGDEPKAVSAIKRGALDYIVKSAATMSGLPHLAEKNIREWENRMERRRAEEALKESEERYRTLIDIIPDGIVEIDMEGCLSYCNSVVYETLGFDSKVLLGKKFWSTITNPALRNNMKEYFLNAIKTQARPGPVTSTVRTKDGSNIDVKANWNYKYDKKGILTGIIAVLTDITEQKKVEGALKESENKYRTLHSNVPVAVFRVDTKGKYISVNPALVKMLGYKTENDFNKLSFPDLFVNRTDYTELIKLLKKNSSVMNFESEIYRCDRTVIWQSFNLKAELNGKGGIAYIDGTSQDITERKQAEDAVKESEMRYRALVESSLQGLILFRKSKIIYVNPAYVKICGYTNKELQAMNLKEIQAMIHPDDLQNVISRFPVGRKRKQATTHLEFRLIRKDRTLCWLDSFSNHIIYSGKSVIQVTIIDITKRKTAELMLRESEARYRELYQRSRDGYFLTDMDGNIREFNSTFQKMLGYKRNELLNISFWDIIPESWHAIQKNLILEQIAERGYSDLAEMEYIKKDGTIFPIEIRGYQVKTENGLASGIWAFVRDITERKETQESLRNFKTVSDKAHFGTAICNNDGSIIYTNKAFAQMHGYTQREMFGAHIRTTHTIEQWRAAKKSLKKLLTEGGFSSEEIGHVKKDGSFFQGLMSATMIKDSKGDPLLYSLSLIDISERKRTEDALKESEGLYSALFHHNPIQTVVVDRQGAIIAFNTAKEKSGDRLPRIGDIMYRDYASLHKIDMYEEMMKCIRSGKLVNFPKQKYGSKILSIKMSGFDGGAIITSQDMTDREKADEELRASEEKYRLVSDNSLDIVSMCDTNLKHTFVSPSCKIVLGYSPDEILGRHIYDFVHPDDLQNVYRMIVQHAPTSEPGVAVYRMLHKNGHYVWIETNGHAVFNSEGILIGAVFGTRDVTKRVIAEEQIKHLNQLLRSIQDVNRLITQEKNPKKLIRGACSSLVMTRGHIDLWIALIDEKEKIISFADSCAEHYIRSENEYQNIMYYPCVQKAIKQSEIVIIQNPPSECLDCPRSGEYKDTGKMLLRLEYNKKIFGVMALEILSPFINNTEEKELLKEVANDIAFALYNIELENERKNLQKQLYQSAKLSAVGQLAAGIAHEFNNILSIILGHAQLSLEEESITDIKSSLNEIEKVTRRGSSIVVKLSAFARPKEPHFRVQEITEVIDDVLKLQQRTLMLENIKVEKIYDKHSMVSIDRWQIEQVLLNLVINATHAIKITGKGKGTITVCVRDAQKNIEIQFSDDGIGMDNNTKLKIFEPFFTTKSTWSEDGNKISGTGLGLSISHTIIKQHNGSITAESEQGIGTTFSILLPSAGVYMEENIPETVIPEIYTGGIKDTRILLVDDEKEMADLMKVVFKRAGLDNVIAENDSMRALAAFESFEPDIVFLDLVMPDMNGEEVFTRIRELNSTVPVVFISGKLDINKEKLMEMGAAGLIQKPFDVNELFSILSNSIKPS